MKNNKQKEVMISMLNNLVTQSAHYMSDKQIIQSFDHSYKQCIQMEMITQLTNKCQINTTKLERKDKITTTKMAKLKEITIDEMSVGKVHEGTYIKLTLIRDCFKMSAIQALVEDNKKRIASLSIYNYSSGKYYRNVFFKGMRIYVKEPYYKASTNGLLNIRIDDPNDIEFAEDVEVLLKDISTKCQKSEEYKQKGNKLFLQKNYIDALIEYNKSIELQNIDQKLSILWSNKAITFINLNCFEDSLVSCQTSLKYNPKNMKSIYRKMISLISLNKFQEANELIKQHQKSFPLFEIDKLKSKIKFRQDCNVGKVDWITLFESTQPQQFFSNKLQIKRSQVAKSLGIHCNKDIQPYQVLIIERAICSIRSSNSKQSNFTFELNLTNKSAEQLSQSIMLRGQCQKLFHQTTSAKNKILSLWDPKSNNLSIKQRQKVQINAPTINAKIAYNEFNMPDIKSAFKKKNEHIFGVWQKTSLLNHASIPNTSIICFGQTFILMSHKQIKKGQQLFISYHDDPELIQKKWTIPATSSESTQHQIFMKIKSAKNQPNASQSISKISSPKLRDHLILHYLFQENDEWIQWFIVNHEIVLPTFSIFQIFNLLLILLDIGQKSTLKIAAKLIIKVFGNISCFKILIDESTYKQLQQAQKSNE